MIPDGHKLKENLYEGGERTSEEGEWNEDSQRLEG